MALKVKERLAEPIGKFPNTVVAEPILDLLLSQENAILARIEELKAQGLATDGLGILLQLMRTAEANLIHWGGPQERASQRIPRRLKRRPMIANLGNRDLA